jgi:hypothetical protein
MEITHNRDDDNMRRVGVQFDKWENIGKNGGKERWNVGRKRRK